MNQIYTPKQDYKVLVSCMTYNHSKYIKDALNGFAMQKTNFPFVCLVMDDCSTDGGQEVIKQWMERECDMSKAEYVEIEKSKIILVPHKSNKQCTFAFYFLKQNMYKLKQQKMAMVEAWRDYCMYEALCEGDDYWISKDKLQKQVDILDRDTSVSMVFHRAKILLEMFETPRLLCFDIEDREYSASELIENWKVPTASIVCRISSMRYPIKNENNVLNGDIIIVEGCAHTGRVIGMSDFMTVYRMQNSGVTYDMNLSRNRTMRYPDHFECIADNFPKIDRRIIGKLLMEAYWERGHIRETLSGKLKDSYMSIKNGGLIPTFKYILKYSYRQLLLKCYIYKAKTKSRGNG